MEDKNAILWKHPLRTEANGYLFHYRGNYLLVPNTPVEVCLNCGMVYFDAKVLKESNSASSHPKENEKPDRYVELPVLLTRSHSSASW